jgi:phage terminase small subunit
MNKALHALHGNPSHKNLDDIKEPATLGPLGPPPECLDDGAREVWLDLQNVMPRGVIASCDLPTMCAYCSSVSLHRRAMVQLRETGGAVIRNHDGDLVKNPWLFVQDRQAVSLRLRRTWGLPDGARFDGSADSDRGPTPVTCPANSGGRQRAG